MRTDVASAGFGTSYPGRMPDLRVLLDTNIYFKDPRRNKLGFSALSRLCKADVVRLFLPFIVQREFQTQLSQRARQNVATIISEARSLGDAVGTPADIGAELARMQELLAGRRDELANAIESELLSWAHEHHVELVDLDAGQAKAAMNGYFVGAAPYKSVKNRADIPDALLLEAVRTLASEPLNVVSDDKAFREACSGLPNTKAFASLDAFIQTQEVQQALQKLDLAEQVPSEGDDADEAPNLEVVGKALRLAEEQDAQIGMQLSSAVGEGVMWLKIHSSTIPDDNGEATISGYSEPDNVTLDFDAIEYFGNREFGVPFKAVMSVTGYYYLFKADLYRSEGRRAGLSDHNDHYYEAEEEFTIEVDGMAKIVVNRIPSPQELIVDEVSDVTLDSIEKLSLLEEDGRG